MFTYYFGVWYLLIDLNIVNCFRMKGWAGLKKEDKDMLIEKLGKGSSR